MHAAATLMAAALVCVASASCPTSCTCRWKNGKETVECVGAGLTSLPVGVQVGTQVLDLSGNSLHALPKDMFVAPGLLNLQRIYLAGCKIGRIDDLAFSRLSNLVELDLGNNLLTAVPSDTFRDFTSLRRLVLSDNPITRIESNAFIYLPMLTTLEMSRSRVDTVMPRAFDGVAHLTSLKLEDNRLTQIPMRALAQLRMLHGVELHGNPWRCDCHLIDLQQWLMAGRVPYGAPLICSSPEHLHGVLVEQVPISELACAPKGTIFRPRNRKPEAFVDDSISFGCQVTGVPEPSVRWFFQGKLISNLSTFTHRPQVFLIRENGTNAKSSILSISSVVEDDAGDYLCEAQNSAGDYVINFTLSVYLRDDDDAAGLTGTQVAGIGVGLVVMALVVVVLLWVLVERWRQMSTFGTNKHVTVKKKHEGKLSPGIHQQTDLHLDREQYEMKGSSLPHSKRTQPHVDFSKNTDFLYKLHMTGNGDIDGNIASRNRSNQPDVIIVNDKGPLTESDKQTVTFEDAPRRNSCHNTPDSNIKVDLIGTESAWEKDESPASEWVPGDDHSWVNSDASARSSVVYDVPKLPSYSWAEGQSADFGENEEMDSYANDIGHGAYAGVTNPFGQAKHQNFRFRNLVPVLPPFPPQHAARMAHSPDEGYEDVGEEGTEV
uniref:Ig-like domain-containing protein n=1 Tax=Strigamia maritima TaxID=126957 RepID=T1IJ99_STRMM